MAQTYNTKDGDMLDLIVRKHYGDEPGIVEQVLEANQGLAEYGPILSAGLSVTLPDIASTQKQGLRLWD